jgi:hypothetical protein
MALRVGVHLALVGAGPARRVALVVLVDHPAPHQGHGVTDRFGGVAEQLAHDLMVSPGLPWSRQARRDTPFAA